MDRNAFHLLLKRYFDGSCSEDERRIVDQWYELLEDEGALQHIPENTVELENRIWEKIHDHVSGPDKASGSRDLREHPLRKIWIRWVAAAAVIACIVVGTIKFGSHKSDGDAFVSTKIKEGLIENINNGTDPKLVRLEEGTTVVLQPHARIAFPKHFQTERREVYFEGEGFFNVTHDAKRPFFVYNNKLVTEVLGTSFNIRIIDNKIEVSVKTGRVAVYENGQRVNEYAQKKEENGVIITPNQKVTYYSENRHFITSLVETPLPVINEDTTASAQKTKFVFDDTPISEVLKSIEKTYEIEIVMENESLKDCPFTGDIRRQNLFNKLEFVCQALQATYEIKGTKILIKGGHTCN